MYRVQRVAKRWSAGVVREGAKTLPIVGRGCIDQDEAGRGASLSLPFSLFFGPLFPLLPVFLPRAYEKASHLFSLFLFPSYTRSFSYSSLFLRLSSSSSSPSCFIPVILPYSTYNHHLSISLFRAYLTPLTLGRPYNPPPDAFTPSHTLLAVLALGVVPSSKTLHFLSPFFSLSRFL